MKILIVSNMYPPYYMGGYEIRCALTAEGLFWAGHEVRVLTSNYGVASTGPFQDNVNGIRVARVLGQYHHGADAPGEWPRFLSHVPPQLRDARHFLRTLNEFKPDLINWWSVSGLTKAILSIPRHRGIPDVFFVEDDWIIEEETRREIDQRPPWEIIWCKKYKPWYWRPLLVWIMERCKRKLLDLGIETIASPFKPAHVCFVSEFLRDEYKAAGVEFPSAEVIYGGAPVSLFFFERAGFVGDGGPLRLLYAGQVTRDRGLDIAIDALANLPAETQGLATLTVVGKCSDSNFLLELERTVRALNLSDRIEFVGNRSYDQMPEIYRRHDILISPSLRKEGLPLTMIEAMLSGCAVVTSGSGGAMEIARSADLPLFPKGNALELSRTLEKLIVNRVILKRIAKRGQDVALREFSSDRMVERIVRIFQDCYDQSQRREIKGYQTPKGNDRLGLIPKRPV